MSKATPKKDSKNKAASLRLGAGTGEIKTMHDKDGLWWKSIEDKIDKAYRMIIAKKGRDINVLDLGCGDGLTIFRLHQMNGSAHYTGIDFDDKYIKFAKDMAKRHDLKNISFERKDIIKDDITSGRIGKFDVVICSEVFEHLYDEEKIKLMNDINKMLKTGGHLLFSTPTPDAFFRKIYESNNPVTAWFNDRIFNNTYDNRILDDFSHGRHHHVGVCSKTYYQKLAYRKGFRLVKMWPSRLMQDGMVPRWIGSILNFIFVTMNPWARNASINIIYLYEKKSSKMIGY